ncbi:hypothetical protein MTO96_010801 [Rhipicephalus appendiculatus]
MRGASRRRDVHDAVRRRLVFNVHESRPRRRGRPAVLQHLLLLSQRNAAALSPDPTTIASRSAKHAFPLASTEHRDLSAHCIRSATAQRMRGRRVAAWTASRTEYSATRK